MTIELTVLIGIVGTITGAILGILTYKKNANKDAAAAGKSDGVVLAKLDYIQTGVDEIKAEQKCQRDNVTVIRVDMARMDSSLRQAHKRIDGIERDLAK